MPIRECNKDNVNKPLIIPGGGPRMPIGGGGPLMPGGPGGPGGMPGRACGCIICGGGAPTPCAGPLRPAAGPDDCAGTPRPAARPTPGPPDAPGIGTRAMPSYNNVQPHSSQMFSTVYVHNSLVLWCIVRSTQKLSGMFSSKKQIYIENAPSYAAGKYIKTNTANLRYIHSISKAQSSS